MRVQPTGRERFFGDDEIIVSKTDLQGRITYANSVFMRVAGYEEAELLGAPHSIVRHPAMPRCVFQLLWQTIEAGEEVFAYVLNLAKDGDHYWVFAHVTPSFDQQGRIVGYHSNRRSPNRDALAAIEPLYASLKREEDGCQSKSDGIRASSQLLARELSKAGLSYPELVFSLSQMSKAS